MLQGGFAAICRRREPGFWGLRNRARFVPAPPAEGTRFREHLELARELSALAAQLSRGAMAVSPATRLFSRRAGSLQQAADQPAIPCGSIAIFGDPLLLHPAGRRGLVVEGQVPGWFGPNFHPARGDKPRTCKKATYSVFRLALAPLLTAATRRNRWQPSYAPYANRAASERDLGARSASHR